MNKSLQKIIATTSIASALLASHAKEGEFGFFGEIGLSLRYEQPMLKSVTSLPDSVTTVPVHPDDYSLARNNGPIQFDSLPFTDRLGFIDVKAGLKLETKHDLTFRAGMQISPTTKLINPDMGDTPFYEMENYASRNYGSSGTGTNTRGFGSALTYIETDTFYLFEGNEYIRPSLFIEGTKKLSDSFSITLGASMTPESYIIRRGYDRYNSKSERDSVELGTIYGVGPYLSLEIGEPNIYAAIEVGAKFPVSEKLTEEGAKSTFEKNEPAITGAAKISFRF